jgi:hypothetical protein
MQQNDHQEEKTLNKEQEGQGAGGWCWKGGSLPSETERGARLCSAGQTSRPLWTCAFNSMRKSRIFKWIKNHRNIYKLEDMALSRPGLSPVMCWSFLCPWTPHSQTSSSAQELGSEVHPVFMDLPHQPGQPLHTAPGWLFHLSGFSAFIFVSFQHVLYKTANTIF